jgi:hypothetical protein
MFSESVGTRMDVGNEFRNKKAKVFVRYNFRYLHRSHDRVMEQKYQAKVLHVYPTPLQQRCCLIWTCNIILYNNNLTRNYSERYIIQTTLQMTFARPVWP